nr:phosphoglycerate mutase-like protein 1 [Tanacetum cinerariifolium]
MSMQVASLRELMCLFSKTMQTAVGVFGREDHTDNEDSLPLMLANAGNNGRSIISSLNCPPIVAVELRREHLDKRKRVVLNLDMLTF